MSTYPYSVCLDARAELTGVYSAPDTTWTIPFSDDEFAVATTRIVLSDDFTDQEGFILTPDSVSVGASSITVVKAGNYSAGKAQVGKVYESLMDCPELMLRNEKGVGDASKKIDLIEMYISLQDTGYLLLRRAMNLRTDYTPTLNPANARIYTEPVWRVRPNGYIGDMVLTFESTDPRPFVITGIQAEVKYA